MRFHHVADSHYFESYLAILHLVFHFPFSAMPKLGSKDSQSVIVGLVVECFMGLQEQTQLSGQTEKVW